MYRSLNSDRIASVVYTAASWDQHDKFAATITVVERHGTESMCGAAVIELLTQRLTTPAHSVA
ncbi:MAG: hypothetical protein ACI9N0_001083 [Ilumatobacter sp.]|jgi:hypothetical protein